MKFEAIQYTHRMERIVQNAAVEAQRNSESVLRPIHLLMGCLNEKGGAMGEMSSHISVDLPSLREQCKLTRKDDHSQESNDQLLNHPISVDLKDVLDEAMWLMNRYGQTTLNEGHLLKALITTRVLDGLINDRDKKVILSLGTTARDMIVHLGDFNTLPIVSNDFQIHQGGVNDIKRLTDFVEHHFSLGWADTVRSGLNGCGRVFFVTNTDDEIIGFAAFDAYQGKKGYFGPMGVLKEKAPLTLLFSGDENLRLRICDYWWRRAHRVL